MINAVKLETELKLGAKIESAKKFGENMTRVAILFFILTGVIAVGLVVLSNWQIPAPISAIDKVIPNEKLQK